LALLVKGRICEINYSMKTTVELPDEVFRKPGNKLSEKGWISITLFQV